MFSSSRKQAQQTARQMLTGHCALIAWWTLRHAGVFDAMVALRENEHTGLEPLVHAARSNMSPDVLRALVDYLVNAGLLAEKKDGIHFTSEGQALYDNEDATLGLLRAYQPVLDMAEHLLAKLKSYSPGISGTGNGNGGGAPGVSRKVEYLLDSQSRRYGDEVFPAISRIVTHLHASHLMDLACGGGELLIHIAGHHKQVVGVGIGADSIGVRRANQTIDAAKLDKRLIAVSANPFDVCLDTQRTFDRIGVSRQLWKELDCLVAVNLFSEFTSRPEEIARVLAAVPRSFPKCRLILAEPVASAEFDRNYYAAEWLMLLRLARSAPLPAERWRELIARAHLQIVSEHMLETDGLAVFTCRPHQQG